MTNRLRALLFVVVLARCALGVAAEPPAILLAEIYRNQVDVAQYLVSDKPAAPADDTPSPLAQKILPG